jgi:hypothetical protein
MKTPGFILLLLALTYVPFINCLAQETAPSRIVILPLHSNGIDSIYIQTAESILRTEIGKLSPMDIVSTRHTMETLNGETCTESDCAIDIGKKLNATQVLGCRLSALGEKIIVQYFLVDIPSSRTLLMDQVTASNVEDLEVLMKRLARSVVNVEPIEKTAQVGEVLVSESIEPARRASRTNAGLSFGYLYPQAGYDNNDRSFVMDGRLDYEINDFAAGIMAGIRKGFAMNLYGSYLFSRTDICPYIGGSFGFHWVSHEHPYAYANGSYTQDNRKSDGFELAGQTGLRILHTYNFQMIFQLEYIYTMNDYNDGAIVFTLGIL